MDKDCHWLRRSYRDLTLERQCEALIGRLTSLIGMTRFKAVQVKGPRVKGPRVGYKSQRGLQSMVGKARSDEALTWSRLSLLEWPLHFKFFA